MSSSGLTFFDVIIRLDRMIQNKTSKHLFSVFISSLVVLP